MKKNIFKILIFLILYFLVIAIAQNTLDAFKLRILNLCAIYTILGLSMNLINGFTGQFSLGHAGFMAIGAYTTALLTMKPEVKEQIFYMKPLIYPLNSISMPFLPALLIGGVLAAVVGYLIGAPALKLKGDYLAIATLGFSEIIRVLITNAQSITNGALGIKGIPSYTNLYWSYGLGLITVIFMFKLINCSYGRAFKAIREDEIAAENMGINLFKHKIMAFTIGSFLAGIGGGLLGNLLGTIDPLMFRFFLTFNILLIIVLGGMGSISGTIIAAFVITIAGEALRFLDKEINLIFVRIPGIPGLRMVVFSALLMIVVLFYRNGLLGNEELSWDKIKTFFKNIKKPFNKGGNLHGSVKN
ncbi:branched-chain amino acid ABC transporter permease [Caloramator sp. Dgby_cultured_2]|uniref:branched-chain amino acid ABC transporter permease n=1 Tax=Caloramator sp. Dgby_cultured_2 TaxID=3029174 RepID=UPI00237E4FF7|nr:branched-chain amino acid ABC transporter permease [Caloramator sp. Dgby_cultured_2]WDU83720.1 branched-chain amino acid ABC transporter permease [Caloramator sp. Dgby_cultured_2]